MSSSRTILTLTICVADVAKAADAERILNEVFPRKQKRRLQREAAVLPATPGASSNGGRQSETLLLFPEVIVVVEKRL
jgi:hypothetical protein